MGRAGRASYHLKDGKISPDGPCGSRISTTRSSRSSTTSLRRRRCGTMAILRLPSSMSARRTGRRTYGGKHHPPTTETPSAVTSIYTGSTSKQTLLVANDDFVIQGRALDMRAITVWRSVMNSKPSFGAYLSYNFWPRVPVILESEHYGSSKKRAWDGDRLAQAIEEITSAMQPFIEFPRAFLKDNRDLVTDQRVRLETRSTCRRPHGHPTGRALEIDADTPGGTGCSRRPSPNLRSRTRRWHRSRLC